MKLQIVHMSSIRWNYQTITLYTWYTNDLKTPVNLRTP